MWPMLNKNYPLYVTGGRRWDHYNPSWGKNTLAFLDYTHKTTYTAIVFCFYTVTNHPAHLQAIWLLITLFSAYSQTEIVKIFHEDCSPGASSKDIYWLLAFDSKDYECLLVYPDGSMFLLDVTATTWVRLYKQHYLKSRKDQTDCRANILS